MFKSLDPLLAFYALPLVAIWTLYMGIRLRSEGLNRARHRETVEAGLAEPSSLHPKIDPARCLGCGACVRACPEQGVLGLIGGKATLVEASSCIGHGACKTACPNDAINLVFGTETRGIDIPLVSDEFESSVPGIFIAGELGGMGLIRNAIKQGSEAMAAIAARARSQHPHLLDVVIVGAGPAGFAASLSALQHGLRFVTLEQETFGGTVAHYPRGKLVMTAPIELPLIGTMNFRTVSKEELLLFWQHAARTSGLEVLYGTHVTHVERMPYGFQVHVPGCVYHTRHVLLTIGRRGTPRKLDVPGEDLPKVVYRLADPEQYTGQKVLVVGGGDSALEAAASIVESAPKAVVTLSYRGEGFGRAKSRNRAQIDKLARASRIRVLLGSEVSAIEPSIVLLRQNGQELAIENNAVIVCAGGVLPTAFLKSMGIVVETKYGTA